MKKYLLAAMLACAGTAQAHECDIDRTYPPSLTELGFLAANFRWLNPYELPPAGWIGGGVREDSCSVTVLPKPRPTHNRALVHDAAPTDVSWTVRIDRVEPINPDSDNFPFWSLQLADSAGTSTGVLTLSLLPGRARIGVTYTEQLASGLTSNAMVLLPLKSPSCAQIDVELKPPTVRNGTRELAVTLLCPLYRQLKTPGFPVSAPLAPRDLRYGKLSDEEGPDGTFVFSIPRP